MKSDVGTQQGRSRHAIDRLGRWSWRHPWATAFAIPGVTGAAVGLLSYAVQGLQGLVLYLAIGSLIGLALAVAWRAYQRQGRIRFHKIKVNLGGQEVEFVVSDRDRQAAWMIFVELVTRIATQPLPAGQGDLREALASLHGLFIRVRAILLDMGPTRSDEGETVELHAYRMLNRHLRPLLATWHPRLERHVNSGGDVEDFAGTAELRDALERCRIEVVAYARNFGEIAEVQHLDKFIDPKSDDRVRKQATG